MFVPERTLLENKLLAVQDLLRVTVFDVDPEGLCGAMVPLVPYKRLMRSDVKLDTNQSARDGLNVSFKLKAWQLMDLVQDGLAHLWIVDNFANLLSVHVVEVMPLELRLLFDFAGDIIEVLHLRELTQWGH